jgi:hypothetical protein
MESVEITFYGDEDGYINMECPFCESDFKMLIDDLENDEINTEVIFCPYCGLKEERNNFFSKEQEVVMQSHLENIAIEMINKSFGDMAKKINRQKGILKMTHKPLKKVNVKEYREFLGSEVIKSCSECGFQYKVINNMGESITYCVNCGGINYE